MFETCKKENVLRKEGEFYELKRKLLRQKNQRNSNEYIGSTQNIIRRYFLDVDKMIPLVIEAQIEGIDLKYWIEHNKQPIEANIEKYGAVLFRGFHLILNEFSTISKILIGELMDYLEGATPRRKKGDRVYSSTEYPETQNIDLHNELSSAQTFPKRIAFFCHAPAKIGGETPIADVHTVFNNIPEAVKDTFNKKGWMLVRNYGKEFGLAWQQSFQTSNKSFVETYCKQNSVEYEWHSDDLLTTRQVRSAIIEHPSNGLPMWFNHAMFWHESRLEPNLLQMLLKEYGKEGLPFSTYFGDGSDIPYEAVDCILAAYNKSCVEFSWKNNDLLLLDNIRMSHGRRPFSGPREIYVTMGNPFVRP